MKTHCALLEQQLAIARPRMERLPNHIKLQDIRRRLTEVEAAILAVEIVCYILSAEVYEPASCSEAHANSVSAGEHCLAQLNLEKSALEHALYQWECMMAGKPPSLYP